MKKVAFLVYQKDSTYKEDTEQLSSYLASLGVEIHLHEVARSIPQKLAKVARGKDTLLLVGYLGHGNTSGWAGLVSYKDLTKALDFEGLLLVLNDTCYSMRLLVALRHVRSVENTSFLAPFGARHTVSVNLLSEAVEEWPYRSVIESRVSAFVTLQGIGKPARRDPPLIRWGVSLEHHFFGNKTRSAQIVTFEREVSLEGSIPSVYELLE
jgi:hypothetical protein